MGATRPRSTTLTEVEKAAVVEFRRRTLLPLDDVQGALRATIPRLTRSALHRCLVHHGISRLPKRKEEATKQGRFAENAIGFGHVDACELRVAEGKRHLFPAIDRVTRVTDVEFHERPTMATGAAFLQSALALFPYRLRVMLTGNGIAAADLPRNRGGWTAWFRGHSFDRVSRGYGRAHRLTKPYHCGATGSGSGSINSSRTLPSRPSTIPASTRSKRTSWRSSGRTTSPSARRR